MVKFTNYDWRGHQRATMMKQRCDLYIVKKNIGTRYAKRYCISRWQWNTFIPRN